MLGAVIGDIIGSVYEFNNIKTKDFPLWAEGCHLTDDTVCTMAVADSLLNRKPIDKTLQEWGRAYAVGYGQKFQEWINAPCPTPYGSWGNGAVMRISPVGFLYPELSTAIKYGVKVTNVTHNHPDSLKAVAAYLTVMNSLQKKESISKIKNIIQQQYHYDMHRTVDEIRPQYTKFYVRCEKSVPEAMICALDATSFEDAIRNAVSLGGDSDTLACMAGALAEVRFGIPANIRQKALGYLDETMTRILTQLYQAPKRIKSPKNKPFSHQITHER